MKTYITIYFNSDGKKPSHVVRKLEDLGFELNRGEYDFMYDWKEETSLEHIMSLGDKIKELFKGDKVLFQIKTTEGEDEDPEEEMKTYMKLIFSAEEGKSPTDTDVVVTDLMDIGFEPIKGGYDYLYRWPSPVGTEAVLEVADRVYEAFEGCGIYFKFKTL